MSKTITIHKKDQILAEDSIPRFKIGKKWIGRGEPCFIVAEIGINFDADHEKALEMIDASAEAGCDAVKFQVFRSERMYTQGAGKLVAANGKKVDIHKLLKTVELPYEWLSELKKYAEKRGMEFFASVCDEISADALRDSGTVAYKIASYETGSHIPLIAHVSGKGLPIIMSCGGCTISETEEAVETSRSQGQKNIVLMHCIAKYDAPLSTLNLNVIKTLMGQFPGLIIGYSDHSAHATAAPIAAVALGAKMVEKHITLDKKSEGPDHSFALEPKELKDMVKAIRKTEANLKAGKGIQVDTKVLGRADRNPFLEEVYVRDFAFRKIFVIKNIKKNELISANNIAVLRPGEKGKKYAKLALNSRYFDLLIGKNGKGARATHPMKVGDPVTWNDVLHS
jgi:sialic acid synthase SpsE